MNDKFQIKTCPTCGSDQIRRAVRGITRKYKGQTYTVPKVGFYDCPNCGEKVYDHEAMLKIEAHSPKFQSILDVAEQQIREGKGIKHEEFWRGVEAETTKAG